MASRAACFDAAHRAAIRLFNGFTEGCPELVVDLYARTIVINHYGPASGAVREQAQQAADFLRSQLPWIQAGILKIRSSSIVNERHGFLIFGDQPDSRIQEDGIWYAIDPTLARDASFYIDTRNLREWAATRLAGKTVLNAFAYTGSLGVAAAAGGAKRVVHLDRNAKYLNLAKKSYALNGLPVHEADFVQDDFFRQAGRLRREDRRFDCVILDPPFFASGSKGTVDQVNEGARLINKARPLVDDGGYLVAINNALYVSGSSYMATLGRLCRDGYMRVEETVPVPQDCVGRGAGGPPTSVADPAPFNHPTKIAILAIRRKSG